MSEALKNRPRARPRVGPVLRAGLRTFLPVGKGVGRLILNWGVLAAVVAGVLIVRNRAAAEAQAPLPATPAYLSATETRQWQNFPAYHRFVPVLLYHGINNSRDSYSVTPKLFADQMRALKVAGFHAITLAQYVAYVHGFWRTLPPKPILLTFDDGRRDAFRVANNVLRNYGFHATMFTFAAWPTTNPGFSLSWPQLRAMQKSGVWTVQEHGGRGHEYLAFNATRAKGGIYAYRRYIPGQSGHAGYLEDFSAFERRVTSDIVWGSQQFQEQIPGYRPLAFAVPYANYGQEETNDRRIPEFTLPWLKGHFGVVFGGDYLAEGRGQPDEIHGRFSTLYSYRMTMGPKMSVGALYCRLNDWVRGTPMWMEYRCMRPPRGVNAIRGGVFTPAGRHAGILPP